MAAHPDHTEILTAAGEWRDQCLLHDGSILSDRQLWSMANLDELDRFFVQKHRLAGKFRFYDSTSRHKCLKYIR